MTASTTINNNIFNNVAALGGGQQDQGLHRGRGGSEDGIDSMAYQFFQKAMQDGKLDKREMQTLQKLAKAEQDQKGQGRCGEKNENECEKPGEKDDKKDCRDKKDCDDKKDCRSDDKDSNKNDRLLSKYIDQAMEDGKLSRFEQKMIDRLLESGKRDS